MATGEIEWFHTKESIVFMTELPLSIPFHMDKRVLLASLALALLSALLCGLAPALQSTRVDLVNGLKSADVDVPGRKRLWGRNVLVVAQVSMSLMLLTASFLMARSFQHSLLGGTGFAKEHLLMASFDPRLVQYNATQTQAILQVAGRAHARNAWSKERGSHAERSAGNRTILTAWRSCRTVFRCRRIAKISPRRWIRWMKDISRRWESRSCAAAASWPTDTADAPRVVVVNQQFAKHYWPAGDAVGKHIRLDSRTGTPVEIVGIAQTIKYQGTSKGRWISCTCRWRSIPSREWF